MLLHGRPAKLCTTEYQRGNSAAWDGRRLRLNFNIISFFQHVWLCSICKRYPWRWGEGVGFPWLGVTDMLLCGCYESNLDPREARLLLSATQSLLQSHSWPVFKLLKPYVFCKIIPYQTHSFQINLYLCMSYIYSNNYVCSYTEFCNSDFICLYFYLFCYIFLLIFNLLHTMENNKYENEK